MAEQETQPIHSLVSLLRDRQRESRVWVLRGGSEGYEAIGVERSGLEGSTELAIGKAVPFDEIIVNESPEDTRDETYANPTNTFVTTVFDAAHQRGIEVVSFLMPSHQLDTSTIYRFAPIMLEVNISAVDPRLEVSGPFDLEGQEGEEEYVQTADATAQYVLSRIELMPEQREIVNHESILELMHAVGFVRILNDNSRTQVDDETVVLFLEAVAAWERNELPQYTQVLAPGENLEPVIINRKNRRGGRQIVFAYTRTITPDGGVQYVLYHNFGGRLHPYTYVQTPTTDNAADLLTHTAQQRNPFKPQ